MDTLIKKHYTEDRKWRYDVENRRMRTLQELIDRREECGPDDNKRLKADVDEKLI